jgi:hypothetical protein
VTSKKEAHVPLITVTAGTPILPASTYNATLIGIAPKKLITKFSKPGVEDDFLEWTWLVEGPDTDVEITSLTSVATGPKSRIVEYLVALLGADKVDVGLGLEENDLVGKKVQVQTIVTEDGFTKIDKIVGLVSPRRATAAQTTTVKAPEAPVDKDLDDLPF